MSARWSNPAFAEWLTEFLKLAAPSIGVSDPRRFDKDLLERSCYPLLIQQAEKYSKKHEFPFEDAIQNGYLGLRSAAARFDPARNVRFATYAFPFITGYMAREYRVRLRSAPTVPFALAFDPWETDDQIDMALMVADVREQVEIDHRESEEDARARCLEYLGLLKPKTREIVCRVHGIGRPVETCSQIANSQGISRQAIHLRYQTAMQILRTHAERRDDTHKKRHA